MNIFIHVDLHCTHTRQVNTKLEEENVHDHVIVETEMMQYSIVVIANMSMFNMTYKYAEGGLLSPTEMHGVPYLPGIQTMQISIRWQSGLKLIWKCAFFGVSA